MHGLPPRVRGNRQQAYAGSAGYWPTPARAGQPSTSGCSGRLGTAYPRACGATYSSLAGDRMRRGLPPRVRGNRTRVRGSVTSPGPTPARAGQPCERAFIGSQSTAYPRACGATSLTRCAISACEGLPPRVRGNRSTPANRPSTLGPTPARAGQPRPYGQGVVRSRAYPRACGATDDGEPVAMNDSGLPPRVRGNHERSARLNPQQGPTPARAGQPARSARSDTRLWAYPRACGATRCSLHQRTHCRGLPPRVRGNLCGLLLGRVRGGPTPARAGQPRGCHTHRR